MHFKCLADIVSRRLDGVLYDHQLFCRRRVPGHLTPATFRPLDITGDRRRKAVHYRDSAAGTGTDGEPTASVTGPGSCRRGRVGSESGRAVEVGSPLVEVGSPLVEIGSPLVEIGSP